MAAKKDKSVADSQAETSTVESSGLVGMRLDDALLEGYTGPTTADVHPDEVNNWKAGGWVIDQQSEGEHAKTTDSHAAAADDASTAAVADGDAANGAASDPNEAGG